jgi:hypothetical protein
VGSALVGITVVAGTILVCIIVVVGIILVGVTVVAGTILVCIIVVIGTILAGRIVIAEVMLVGITFIGRILVLIAFVATAGVARVNRSFRKHFEVLFRDHGLERNATDEHN